jgi:uncharacterized membrane protein YhaH (DUF805 family)
MSDAWVESSPEVKSAAGRLRRAAFLLAVATAMAIASAAAIFGFVFYADFLTGAAASVTRVMFAHSALAVGAAASPIFAALLVGYGYMQRGVRRRAAAKAASARAS